MLMMVIMMIMRMMFMIPMMVRMMMMVMMVVMVVGEVMRIKKKATCAFFPTSFRGSTLRIRTFTTVNKILDRLRIKEESNIHNGDHQPPPFFTKFPQKHLLQRALDFGLFSLLYNTKSAK